MNGNSSDALDALAGVVARLISRMPGVQPQPFGPVGGPVPGLPDIPFPPEQLPDLMPQTRLLIEGMEFTQSTQFYRSRHGETNSVPLVALKPMVVRVYPYVAQGLFHPDTLTGQKVTGELIVSHGNKEIYRTGPTRPDGVRVGAAGDLERSLWDRELTVPGGGGVGKNIDTSFRLFSYNPPLSFLVPAYYLRPGISIITVRLQTESGARVERWERIMLHNVRAPKIAMVRVNWQDEENVVHRPTDQEMLDTLNLSRRMLPFPYFETLIISLEETKPDDFAQVAAGGGCNTAWNDLLEILRERQKLLQFFGGIDILFGVVSAAGVPATGMINSGCGDGDSGVGAAFVGFEGTAAHELGHIYGRSHAAVPGATNNDPNYPKYGGRATSVGEFGVDIGARRPELKDPRVMNDVMSYATPQWISPYTYQGIFDERTRWRSAAAQRSRVRPILLLTFRLMREVRGTHRVEIKSAHRFSTTGIATRITGPASRSVSIDLIDAKDRIIATHHAYAASAQPCCGCGSDPAMDGREPWLSFTEAVEWPEDAEVTAISFHRGGEPLAQVKVGEPPRLELEGPCLEDDSLKFFVHASHPNETPSVVVLFTGDDGETWVPLAVNPPFEKPIRIAYDRLTGGERCRLRAIATAELRSVEQESDTFEIPRKGREIHLSLSENPCEPGEVHLGALINTRGFGVLSPGEIQWTSDQDGDLGRGYDLEVSLSQGRHSITASIPDGRGSTISARGIIVVGGRQEDVPLG